jgi:hypothetical protein
MLFSREIALLRLREVKLREELFTTEQAAKKSLVDDRLRCLELRSAIVRMSHSAAASFTAHGTEERRAVPLRASSAPRLRVKGEATGKRDGQEEEEEAAALVSQGGKALSRRKSFSIEDSRLAEVSGAKRRNFSELL